MSAFRSGVRRVNGAPALLVGVWLATLLAALPLALTLRQMIAESLGGSTVATAPSWRPSSVTPPDSRDPASAGSRSGSQPGAWDPASAGLQSGFGSSAWLRQFSDEARGVGRAFSPSTFGFAAVLDNLSSLLDNRAHPLPVVVAGVFYAVLWIFLTGGIIDRYARNYRTRAYGFSAACGGYFFRLIRLAVLASIVYFVLFAYVHPLLEGTWGSLTADSTSERGAFALRLVLYAVVAGVFCLCNLVFDFARVRTVIEDRRSMLAAIAATVGFIRHRPGVGVLYLLNGGCFVAAVLLYGLVAPGLGAPAWWVLLAGQAYILARLWVKMLFYASEVAFFQDALAHADYTAAPVPRWPDSPAADAIVPR